MNWKIGIAIIGVVAVLTMVILSVGYEQNNPKKFALKYNLNEGEEFTYNVLYSEGYKNIITTPMKIETKILEASDNIVSTKGVIITTKDEKQTPLVYYIKMTPFGEIIDSQFENLMIPEVQQELPNILPYPREKIEKSQNWTVPIKKSGNFVPIDNSSKIKYILSGTKKYTIIGSKKISVAGGNFESAGIKSYINATIQMNMTNLNATVYSTITLNSSGEDWVDQKGGFLIKSIYIVNKTVLTDLSEMYKQNGSEKFYRETPINSQLNVELLKIVEI